MAELTRCKYLVILVTVLLLPMHVLAVNSGQVRGMEKRLQQLEDREAIRNLMMEYGRTLDARDFKSFSELFAQDDGEWNGGMGVAKGPAAIRKLMEDTIGKNTGGVKSPNFHIFNNEVITVEGDRATALSKWTFVVQGEDNRPQWVYLGHYHDIFIKQDGRWKFLQRKVTSAIPGE